MTAATALSAADRQTRVDRFLQAGNIGTAAILLYPTSHIAEAIWGMTLPTLIVLFVSVTLMMIGLFWAFGYMTARRNTDEYTRALWTAGTTAAFFAIVLWLLPGALIEDMIAGAKVVKDPLRADPEINVIAAWSLPVAIGGFFIGFHFKRWKGGW